MDITCIDLHKHEDKILAEEKPETFLESVDEVKAFEEHIEEIKITVEKSKRVYLLFAADFNFSGVFHSVDAKRLTKILNKPKDAQDVSAQVCRLMAAGNGELGTLKKLNEIVFDQCNEIPPTIVISISNILLTREGIGIQEAGKN